MLGLIKLHSPLVLKKHNDGILKILLITNKMAQKYESKIIMTEISNCPKYSQHLVNNLENIMHHSPTNYQQLIYNNNTNNNAFICSNPFHSLMYI